jgi:hypothetical protein
MSLIANPIFLGAPRRPPIMRGLSAVTRPRRRGLGDGSALGYLPAGTQLVYNVTVSVSVLVPELNPTAANVAAKIAANVSQNSGITVIGSNAPTSIFNPGGGITLTLQLNQPYTTAQMVQAVMDSAVNGILGISVISSNISVTSFPGGAAVDTTAAAGTAPVGSVPGAGAAASAPAPTDPLTWLTTNAGWLAAGVVGFFLLREVL